MTGRTHPISKFIFLSIISHGLLIFLSISFWELNFPKGSEPYPNVIRVTLIGKKMEKTPALFESKDLITSNPSREEKAHGIGTGKDEQIVQMESGGTEPTLEVYQKIERNLQLEREVYEGALNRQQNSSLSNPLQKDAEAFASPKNEEALRDPLQASFSLEKNLVSADRNLHEEGSEASQWEEDPEWTRYQREVVRRIEKGKRYPFFAKMRNMSGVVVVGFTIGAEGRASDIEVIRSSDQKILDREALDTIRRVSPFPPFPEGFRLSRMNLTISLKFDLKKS